MLVTVTEEENHIGNVMLDAKRLYQKQNAERSNADYRYRFSATPFRSVQISNSLYKKNLSYVLSGYTLPTYARRN